MASSVELAVKEAIGKQEVAPVTVSDGLREQFLKKSRSASWKLLPISIVVSAVVIIVLFLLIYFLRLMVFSLIGLICIIYPIYAVYNIFATAKAIRNQDYEFFSGEIVGKTDSGYQVRGLEEHNISPLIGKKDYNPGERAIVARLSDELSLISE